MFIESLHSLYPHLFSRAYINFKNPEEILLFRDRFDGYVFIDNKGIWFCFGLAAAKMENCVQLYILRVLSLNIYSGLEYPAVVEFAPFQKISKKKLKKKDAKAGSIEEGTKSISGVLAVKVWHIDFWFVLTKFPTDPEYKRFLENYSCDEEKSMANPETLLGEIEAKTRELIGRALLNPDFFSHVP